MSSSSGNFWKALLEILSSIFRKKKEPPQPPTPPNDPNVPVQITTSKVLVIVYDPVTDPASGSKLSEEQHWQRTEELATEFMTDILQHSENLARYQIVERIDVAEFPPKVDSFRYTPQSYLDVLQGAAPPHMPQEVDYYEIIKQFNLLSRVARGDIDEVWVFGFPHAGFYESIMAGPNAFWCNSPPLKNTEAAKRRFVIMGFSYERGVGEMLESFGHRAESIMAKTYEKKTGTANLWRRFVRYDKVAPGKAAVGTIHFAPNSVRDYDWNNSAVVKSECYDWLLNFPNFKGDIRDVSADEWGNGDTRAHHQWWLKHLPHVAGRKNGVLNNWWPYIINPQNVEA